MFELSNKIVKLNIDIQNYKELILSLRNINEHKRERFFTDYLEETDLRIISSGKSFLYRINIDNNHTIGFNCDCEDNRVEVILSTNNSLEEFLLTCPEVYKNILLFNLNLLV